MVHIPPEELTQKLADVEREVEVGARYIHYKDFTKEKDIPAQSAGFSRREVS